MRLEPELWDALLEICERENQQMSVVVRQIESVGCDGGRTSAVRVFVVNYFRAAARSAPHRRPVHGKLFAPDLVLRLNQTMHAATLGRVGR
jgi:predicted DNA-binding ribbon-helix-helix protein